MNERHTRKTGVSEPQPESRLLFMQLGMLIVPVGLIVFAWAAEKQVHWIVSAKFPVNLCTRRDCFL